MDDGKLKSSLEQIIFEGNRVRHGITARILIKYLLLMTTIMMMMIDDDD